MYTTKQVVYYFVTTMPEGTLYPIDAYKKKMILPIRAPSSLQI